MDAAGGHGVEGEGGHLPVTAGRRVRPGRRGRGRGPGPPGWAGGTWALRRIRPTRGRTGRPAPRPPAPSRSGSPAPSPPAADRTARCPVGPVDRPTGSAMASDSSSACSSTSSRRCSHTSVRAASTVRNDGRAAPVRRGEVGPAEERSPVRGEEHAHGPPARTGDGLDGLHVDGVDVGALLAVHLDGDERGVELRGRGRVLERLVGHDVAPVAGRVADGEEDGLVLGRGPARRPRRPTGYQSTGLSACWRRYGEVSSARRFGLTPVSVVTGR